MSYAAVGFGATPKMEWYAVWYPKPKGGWVWGGWIWTDLKGAQHAADPHSHVVDPRGRRVRSTYTTRDCATVPLYEDDNGIWRPRPECQKK